MLRHIRDDYHVYRRPLLAQGFWAVAFHRYGQAASSIRSPLLRFVPKAIHIVLIKLSEIFFGIYIGSRARIGRRLVIEHFGGVIINSEAVIGDDVRLRHGVTIGNKLASRPRDVPTIGNNVDVGAGAKILGRITVGDEAVIGANAVVITTVPAHAIAVGVPARIITKRAAPDILDDMSGVPDIL